MVHLLRTSGDKRTIEMWRILNSLIFNLTKNVLAWCGHGHGNYETLTSGTSLIRSELRSKRELRKFWSSWFVTFVGRLSN